MELTYSVVNLMWCYEMFRGNFQECYRFLKNVRTTAYIDGVVLMKSLTFDEISKK